MQVFEVFYDGACPLCSREIRWLMGKDKKGRIRFTDIASPMFEPKSVALSRDELMSQIHGRHLPSGQVIAGIEVFRQLYAAVGLGPLVALTRLPGLAPLFEAGYRVFAKNRLRWTGRCEDGSCAVR